MSISKIKKHLRPAEELKSLMLEMLRQHDDAHSPTQAKQNYLMEQYFEYPGIQPLKKRAAAFNDGVLHLCGRNTDILTRFVYNRAPT